MTSLFVATHVDSETDFETFIVVPATDKENAVIIAEGYVAWKGFTDGFISDAKEATEEEVATLKKFGIVK